MWSFIGRLRSYYLTCFLSFFRGKPVFEPDQMDLLDNITLRESLNHILTDSQYLPLIHTCCQILLTHWTTLLHIGSLKQSFAGPALLIPVLDSHHGTETKVILHLLLLPLILSSDTLIPTPWEGCILFRTCTPEKHCPLGHLNTDGNGSNLPIQGDWYRPQFISGAPSSTGQQDDTSWWRTWSDFKGG